MFLRHRTAGRGTAMYGGMARRSVVKVWVSPVASSVISSDDMTLQGGTVGITGITGVDPGPKTGVATEVNGVKTTARICARAFAAVDGTGGLKTSDAAVAGGMLVTAVCFSKAPASS